MDFSAASYAETTLSLNLLQQESLNNVSFVAAPLFIFYMIYPHIMEREKSGSSKIMNKLWRGSNFAMESFTAQSAVSAPFLSPLIVGYPTAAAHYNKWIFDKKKNETIRNPMKPEMAAKEANEMILRITGGHINQLSKPSDLEDGSTIYYSANYFQAWWKHKFDPSETFKGPFHSSKNSEKNVDFMSLNGVYRNYSENEHFQMLSLPYDLNTSLPYNSIGNYSHAQVEGAPFGLKMMEVYNLTLSMNIFLPKTRFGLHKALKSLHYAAFDELLTNAKETLVKASIPKFSMGTEFDCEAYYKRLGLGEFLYNGTTKSESEEREECDKYFRSQDWETAARNSYDGEPNFSCPQRPNKFRAMSVIGMDENGSNTGTIPEIPIESTFVKLSHPKDAKKQKTFIADHPFMFVVTSGMHPVLVGTHF